MPLHPAAAQAVSDWRPLTAEASQRFGVPVEWIERVMQAESGGRTSLGGHPIVSRAGAMGLMQLMPGTWEAMRRSIGLGSDPFEPRDNILAGTAYLREMIARFGYPGAFAAYDAGPSRYAAYVAGVRPLPVETIRYLAVVAASPSRKRAVDGSERPFVARHAAGPPSLFLPLRTASVYARARGGGAGDPLFAIADGP